MSALNERPIIFPLSNPTNKCEVSAENAYRWSKARVLYAAGVQFPDVELDGITYHPGQANNFYIFPAIGLAVYATRPKRINDAMLIAAARASTAPARARSGSACSTWTAGSAATFRRPARFMRWRPRPPS